MFTTRSNPESFIFKRSNGRFPDEEPPEDYRPGGFHSVHPGDIYNATYKVIHKLGFGSYSTVWLAEDLR